MLCVSRSGYYAWLRHEPSARKRADERLSAEIAAIHERSGKRYGSVRVHVALRKLGIRVGRKRVERLMRENGLMARGKRRFRRTTDSNHAEPIAPNVVERQFEPGEPNRVWAGDVTYIATETVWAYLAVVLDLHSRRVVGWAISTRNDTELVLLALRRAVRCRAWAFDGLIFHSDRGSTYASGDYRKELEISGMTASMSRKGDCWDNAVVESFFATLRAELVDDARYATPAEAARSIGEYIERFYNAERLHSHLDYVSPIEFDSKCQLEANAA